MTAVKFDNSYIKLPSQMYSRQLPTPVSSPELIKVNHELCAYLNIDPLWLESDEGVAVLAGNRVPDGAAPIAAVYAGHQFGHWNPQLGDGRAVLLGEVLARDKQRFDIQLKGSGPTPYSRGGDGRAPLGPVLREYIVCEAMAALGVRTSRALAAVTTGDSVYREGFQPGAVLTRVARSHIRIGTFQFFAARGDSEALNALCNHVIDRHFPDVKDSENPTLALLNAVITAQAKLIASWQLLGFIHGVMNTDNVLLSGDTIDYGPCAFMDGYDPGKVFSSIDRGGRYAYNNQPSIGHWNLAALAQALLPLISSDQAEAVEMAQQAVNEFPAHYDQAFQQGICKKLGLAEIQPEDAALSADLFDIMQKQHADFTHTFYHLSKIAHGGESLLDEAFSPWLQRWQARRKLNSQKCDSPSLMSKANPVYIPRNHLIEAAIQAAAVKEDFEPFHKLVAVLSNPWQERDGLQEYWAAPESDQLVQHTFCGT